MAGLDDVGSIIIDLIREGRRLLTNTYQASIGDRLLCRLFVFFSLHVLQTSAVTPDH